MWGHGQSTRSTTPPHQPSPSHLTLLSTVGFSSSPSKQWTLSAINRPHDLSRQAYKSPSDASVTTPQLFINFTISWLACTVSHGVYPESLDIKSIMWYNTCECISPWTVQGSAGCWSQARRQSSPPVFAGRPSGSPTSLAGCRKGIPSEEGKGSTGR